MCMSVLCVLCVCVVCVYVCDKHFVSIKLPLAYRFDRPNTAA